MCSPAVMVSRKRWTVSCRAQPVSPGGGQLFLQHLIQSGGKAVAESAGLGRHIDANLLGIVLFEQPGKALAQGFIPFFGGGVELGHHLGRHPPAESAHLIPLPEKQQGGLAAGGAPVPGHQGLHSRVLVVLLGQHQPAVQPSLFHHVGQQGQTLSQQLFLQGRLLFQRQQPPAFQLFQNTGAHGMIHHDSSFSFSPRVTLAS